jgi:hypothetical protein
MTTTLRSLVLSGGGRYADPWHPFAKTSARLADVLWSLGHRVEVTDFIPDRVADPVRVRPDRGQRGGRAR